MTGKRRALTAVATMALVLLGQAPIRAQEMSFFITSRGPGNGADLGGLSGADAHCETLAEDVGAGGRNWRAYLSAGQSEAGTVVHARDRIGSGPWFNAAGEQIAADVRTATTS